MDHKTDYKLKDRIRFKLKRYLPGDTGALNARFDRWSRWRKTEARFKAAQAATDGKVAIDLGANIGEFTKVLAEKASFVYAFEPDPWTADLLRRNTAHLPNVEVIEAAASDKPGKMQIFRHRDYADNPQGLSQSSTLVPDSPDIDGATPVAEVEVIDFMAFLRDRDLQVGIMKVDIEGGEIALMNALLDSPERERVDYIFCETHEVNYPKMRADFRALRKRAKGVQRPVVNLDWL